MGRPASEWTRRKGESWSEHAARLKAAGVRRTCKGPINGYLNSHGKPSTLCGTCAERTSTGIRAVADAQNAAEEADRLSRPRCKCGLMLPCHACPSIDDFAHNRPGVVKYPKVDPVEPGSGNIEKARAPLDERNGDSNQMLFQARQLRRCEVCKRRHSVRCFYEGSKVCSKCEGKTMDSISHRKRLLRLAELERLAPQRAKQHNVKIFSERERKRLEREWRAAGKLK